MPLHRKPTTSRQARPNLSRREWEIVQLIAAGYSSKLIAERLNISPHTVSTHRKRVLEKTQADNSVSMVQTALRNGWI